MAVAASMLAVVGLFADLGFSRAVIHYDSISGEVLASLYWLNLLVSVVLSVLFATTAPMLGRLFKIDGLSSVLMASSPVFVLSAAGQQFRTLAEKQLQFSSLALIEIVSAGSGLLVAVLIALTGGGVYALVAAALVTAAISSTLAWSYLAERQTPRLRLRIQEAKLFLQFGGYLMGEGFINTLIRQADVLVAGSMTTPTALGLFSLPRDLSMRMGMVVNPVITRVGFPVMSRLQGDLPALKSVYLQTLRMTASVNFPAYTALALFADEVVSLLYGPQWKGAALYLRVLAIWGLLRSVGNPVSSLLHAVGAVRRALVWNIAILAIAPLLYWAATSGGGMMGLAMALVGLHLALIVPSWHFLIRPCCGSSVGEYLSQLSTPLVLSLAAAFAAWLATRGVSYSTVRLAMGGTVGAIVYLGLSYWFNRSWFYAMWSLLRLPSDAMPR
jgi:O-antigen/teichoic acid export membrane protein